LVVVDSTAASAADPAILAPVSELAFLKDERRQDKAEAVHGRTDHWDFKRSGASGEHSLGVPTAQLDRVDFLSLAEQIRLNGGIRNEEDARA
jgi:hypothetical protein